MQLLIIILIMLVFLSLLVTALVCIHSKYGSETLVENASVDENTYDDEAKILVVLLHGFTKKGNSLDGVADIIRENYVGKGVNLIQPDLPLGLLSTASIGRIVSELILAITHEYDKKESSNQPYEHIVFVGHSFGALFARKLYVAANGEFGEVPFEKELSEQLKQTTGLVSPQPWVNKVERIVLLAGMNRGWSISHHMSIPRALKNQLGVGLGYLIELVSGKLPTILTIRRGGSFITQLRLQWLEVQKQLAKYGAGIPTTVQLLGTIDDMVAPDDNIDLVTGNNFIYFEVPESGHESIIEMSSKSSSTERAISNLQKTSLVKAEERGKLLIQALTVTNNTAPNQDIYSSNLQPDINITDVVFVIHGIRDLGHWTKKIARRTQTLASKRWGEQRKVITETSSYGYFPMLSFLIPGARQKKVEWFMDRYTEAKALYPNAKFHYVGHSHGTYLLAKALKVYQSVQFENVVFAGSVVKKRYEWNKYIPSRIKNVQNFVASEDWVVATFPNAFQRLNWQDLGSAGHDGFDLTSDITTLHQPEPPYAFVKGGHGAALQEKMWNSIADFILTGIPKKQDLSLMVNKHSKFIMVLSYLSPAIFLLLIILFVGVIPYYLFNLDIREWVKTIGIVVYTLFVWMIITRV